MWFLLHQQLHPERGACEVPDHGLNLLLVFGIDFVAVLGSHQHGCEPESRVLQARSVALDDSGRQDRHHVCNTNRGVKAVSLRPEDGGAALLSICLSWRRTEMCLTRSSQADCSPSVFSCNPGPALPEGHGYPYTPRTHLPICRDCDECERDQSFYVLTSLHVPTSSGQPPRR